MSNKLRSTLYIGMTNDIERRVSEHKSLKIAGFTQKYKCVDLIYFEDRNSADAAIQREKQLKKWSRNKKDMLIEAVNPGRRDLSTTVEMTAC